MLCRRTAIVSCSREQAPFLDPQKLGCLLVFSTIYAGQIAVDLNDSRSHTLVWRGVAGNAIDAKAKPDKERKNLAKAVAKLLKNYPPQVPTAK